jgi:hypothetical protein
MYYNVTCSNCRVRRSSPRKWISNGSGGVRCKACYEYFRTKGVERPSDDIEATTCSNPNCGTDQPRFEWHQRAPAAGERIMYAHRWGGAAVQLRVLSATVLRAREEQGADAAGVCFWSVA